jgi:hypothetical protein
MGASIHQLVIIYQKDSTGNTKLLSFSVLIVFLHMVRRDTRQWCRNPVVDLSLALKMIANVYLTVTSCSKLFELRVFKSVCKYTAIIQQTVFEIRVFFIIFAAGIFAFTIAILHLLRSCPYEGCEAPETGFSDHFAGALSATYFFMASLRLFYVVCMCFCIGPSSNHGKSFYFHIDVSYSCSQGGIWDPIGDEFKTHRWAFHIMMAIYFFFTVIVMLNVLIGKIPFNVWP